VTVGEARVGQCVVDASDGALVEVPGPGRLAELPDQVVVCALRRDDLVRLAERLSRRRANRVAHRVPGDERGGNDRRAEHQPEDDERRTCAPASGIPDTELEEERITKREETEGAERDRDSHAEDDEECFQRYAEELAHLRHRDPRKLEEGDLVVIAPRRRLEEQHEAFELARGEPAAASTASSVSQNVMRIALPSGVVKTTQPS
jgi:hypothetical protein